MMVMGLMLFMVSVHAQCGSFESLPEERRTCGACVAEGCVAWTCEKETGSGRSRTTLTDRACSPQGQVYGNHVSWQ